MVIAKYLRFSVDDGKAGDSESVSNTNIILKS
jgi:hypothetical protein